MTKRDAVLTHEPRKAEPWLLWIGHGKPQQFLQRGTALAWARAMGYRVLVPLDNRPRIRSSWAGYDRWSGSIKSDRNDYLYRDWQPVPKPDPHAKRQ
jgi:hypothetical protein